MITNLNGNLLDSPAGIICHQCNCQNTMGSGVALAIRKRYPEAYDADCLVARSKLNVLGNISTAFSARDNRYIVNIYGQDSYGNDGKRYTNYEAVYSGLQKTLHFASTLGRPAIGFPWHMGCGLGGGSWCVVEAMIADIFKSYPIVYIVQF